MKCNLTDSGTGTMLIIRGPEGFTGGKVVDTMTSHLDIFPTICDVLNIEKPKWLEGKSLLPLLEKEKEVKIHDEIFTEVNFHVCYEPLRSVRTKRWKYIKRFHSRNKPVLPNCDDSLSKSSLLENCFIEQETEEEQLYDLIFDPNETNNLANDIKYSATLDILKQKLNIWMKKTNDPLLKGEIKPPSGARLNYPNRILSKEKLYTHDK
jgi:N-sulfoglucosamine sulfohydrolase